MWKPLTRAVNPGGAQGKLSVLFFHRVFATQDPLLSGEPDARWFDAMLGWMQSQFSLLPLAEAVTRLQQGSLPPAAAAISFDDGYRDNLAVAAPILACRGIPATFFIATSFLDGGIMFNNIVHECLRACPLDELSLPEVGPEPLPLRSWTERGIAASRLLTALKYLAFEQRETVVRGLPVRCRVSLPNKLMMRPATTSSAAAAATVWQRSCSGRFRCLPTPTAAGARISTTGTVPWSKLQASPPPLALNPEHAGRAATAGPCPDSRPGTRTRCVSRTGCG